MAAACASSPQMPSSVPDSDAPPATISDTGLPLRATTTLSPTPTGLDAATPSAAPSGPLAATGGGTIVVDHDSVALFQQIPESYLQAAANLHMFFMDRSVGFNIDNALDCLAFPSDEAAPNRCIRWRHVVPEFSADPSDVDWARPGGYDRSRWVYETWPDLDCSDWSADLRCFLTVMDTRISQYDVVSFQYSYLEVSPGSDIADEPGGFFSNDPDGMDVYDLQAYEAAHPEQVFIYWTTSLARGIGSPESVAFNERMRQFAIDHGEPLFDVADILSHDLQGRPCYDNRDGVAYANGNQSEDYPDDALDLPAICQSYTTEVDGGHLGSVSTGNIRVAKALWVLMAQIAGWRP